MSESSGGDRVVYCAAVDDYVRHLADSVRSVYPWLATRLDQFPAASDPGAAADLDTLSGHIIAGVYRTGEYGRRLDGVGPFLDRIVVVLQADETSPADIDEVLHETKITHLDGVNRYVARPSPFRCTSDHNEPDIATAQALERQDVP